MSSLKGEGKNLLSSNSVAGKNLPASRLANPNVHWMIIPVHLSTHELPNRLSLSSYCHNFLEGIISQQSIHSSNGKLFGGALGDHSYLDSPDNIIMTNHCHNCFYSVPMTCLECKDRYIIRFDCTIDEYGLFMIVFKQKYLSYVLPFHQQVTIY